MSRPDRHQRHRNRQRAPLPKGAIGGRAQGGGANDRPAPEGVAGVSRHQLPTKSPRFEVFIGWDPVLQTYFAQVYDTKGEEDEQPFIWLGAIEPTTWKEILDEISPYAAVSPLEMAQRLVEDKRLNRGSDE